MITLLSESSTRRRSQMLIATLPPVYREQLLFQIVSHPTVYAVRYNTGVDSPYSPYETVRRAKELADRYEKPLYLDLKGRQLRILEWSVPPYGSVVLNHRIQVNGPAQVYFRGDDACSLREVVNGNL